MAIKIIDYTPLIVGAHAIRTCWNSFDKSDKGGEKDRELINRVGNKYKHKSVLEHLRILISMNNYPKIIQMFKENPFSNVTKVGKEWIISTNVRALQEMKMPGNIKYKFIPNEYTYLFEELSYDS